MLDNIVSGKIWKYERKRTSASERNGLRPLGKTLFRTRRQEGQYFYFPEIGKFCRKTYAR
jgi:hypothetical protein